MSFLTLFTGNLTLAGQTPRCDLFPFGGGPRICPGENLALTRLLLFIASIAQKFTILPATTREEQGTVDPARDFELGLLLHPKAYQIRMVPRIWWQIIQQYSWTKLKDKSGWLLYNSKGMSLDNPKWRLSIHQTENQTENHPVPLQKNNIHQTLGGLRWVSNNPIWFFKPQDHQEIVMYNIS